jgi:PIN domain nuclease of toxin-antitoxin system
VSSVLLDTCALIWIAADEWMEPSAKRAIITAAKGEGLLVSPISAWEVSLLATRGRFGAVSTADGADRWFKAFLARDGVRLAEFNYHIAIDSASLPESPHRDPADRFLIATARHLQLPLVTRDGRIVDYAQAGHVLCIPC